MPTIRTRPENLPTGLLLAGAGGFLDAYTFVGRGGVFANAQTGNIVLLAVAAGERHWQAALQISTFRSLQGIDYSTTLTTSNLRTLVAKAYRWRADHDATAGRQAARIAAVVTGFGVGAAVGALCTRFFGPRAVWVAAGMLVLALAAIITETVTLSRPKGGGGAR
jgi:uncharacterized membrane protein YoaK (UPF0700 family)